MIQYFWPVSLSPGNEQSFRWGSEAAVTEGSFNYPGVKSAAVDAMIEALLKAEDRDDFVSADARARSRAAVGRLCHSAVPFAAPMGRALERPEAARDDAALRLSDRQPGGSSPTGASRSATAQRSPDATMSTLPAEAIERKQRGAAAHGRRPVAAARQPAARRAPPSPIRPISRRSASGAPQTFTYREADAAVDALASFFIELGLEPGDTIAVQLPNLALSAADAARRLARRADGRRCCRCCGGRHEIGKVCEEIAPKALIGVSSLRRREAMPRRSARSPHRSSRCASCSASAATFPTASPRSMRRSRPGRRAERASIEAPPRQAPAMITFTARAGAPLVPVVRSEDELLAQGRDDGAGALARQPAT